MTKKSPTEIDRHVGSRLKMRRMMLGFSQEKVGDHCGVSFQQIQKMEKGANRIGASRLQQLSILLKVPVAFFFDGAPDGASTSGAAVKELDDLNEFTSSKDGQTIIRAFTKMKPEARHAMAQAFEATAGA